VQVALARQPGRGSVPYSQVSPSVHGQVLICEMSAGQAAVDVGHAPCNDLGTPALWRRQSFE
jgi:hypothetical protein